MAAKKRPGLIKGSDNNTSVKVTVTFGVESLWRSVDGGRMKFERDEGGDCLSESHAKTDWLEVTHHANLPVPKGR